MADCNHFDSAADTSKTPEYNTDTDASPTQSTTSLARKDSHQPLDLSLASPSPGDETRCEKQEICRTPMDKSLTAHPQVASTSTAKYLPHSYKNIWPSGAFESMIQLGFLGGDGRIQNRDIIENYRYANLDIDFHKHILQRQAESNLSIGRLIPTPELIDTGECHRQEDRACSCASRCSERKTDLAEESNGENAEKSEAEESVKAPEQSVKSRKRKLSESKMDDGYLERRRKNNAAAKKSRDARRANEQKIAARADFLEKENLRLRIELETLLRNKHYYS